MYQLYLRSPNQILFPSTLRIKNIYTQDLKLNVYVGVYASICVSKNEKIKFLGQSGGQQLGGCLDKYLFVCSFLAIILFVWVRVYRLQ